MVLVTVLRQVIRQTEQISYFDTIPAWPLDRLTHVDSMYRASIASCWENGTIYACICCQRVSICLSICLSHASIVPQEAQLLQRNCTMHYVSKFVLFHEVWELESFQTAKVTFKVIEGHWQWCHSIRHIRLLLDFHCNHVFTRHLTLTMPIRG